MSPPEENLTYRFDGYTLDAANRQLRRGETPVELSARYFDALVLLVREHGQLVEKDRFFAEVWDDVVVSDSALTQCIKEVRKQLGDDASRPRYIQTVPRYGYRFIGSVEVVTDDAVPSRSEEVMPRQADALAASAPLSAAAAAPTAPAQALGPSLRATALWGSAGALGGGFAGVLGGLLYGSALAYSPDAGLGTASILLVLLSLNVLVGAVGGAGVSFGMAAVGWIARRPFRWTVLGSALGGLVVGGGAKLLSVDAFNLLFGEAPAGITGGLEGAALGAAVALGARLGDAGTAQRWRPTAGAGVAGAAAGVLISVAGGHLMGGSLDLLAQSFSGSRLHLDALGRVVGEVHFGHTAQAVLGGIEGLLFGSCVVGALTMARQALSVSDLTAA